MLQFLDSGKGKEVDMTPSQHWKHLIQRENTSLQPDSIKTDLADFNNNNKKKNLDPKLLVSTKDYKCGLCKHHIKAGEFHYHEHKKPSKQSHLGKRWTN